MLPPCAAREESSHLTSVVCRVCARGRESNLHPVAVLEPSRARLFTGTDTARVRAVPRPRRCVCVAYYYNKPSNRAAPAAARRGGIGSDAPRPASAVSGAGRSPNPFVLEAGRANISRANEANRMSVCAVPRRTARRKRKAAAPTGTGGAAALAAGPRGAATRSVGDSASAVAVRVVCGHGASRREQTTQHAKETPSSERARDCARGSRWVSGGPRALQQNSPPSLLYHRACARHGPQLACAPSLRPLRPLWPRSRRREFFRGP